MSESPSEVEQRTSAPVERGADDSSTGQLIGRASEQLSDLVRSEMQLARTEISESAKRAGIGAGLFGVAGVVAVYAGAALVTTAVAALALLLDLWLAALIVAVVLLAVAGVAALLGKGQVSRTAPPVQQSVDSVKQDLETIKGGKTA